MSDSPAALAACRGAGAAEARHGSRHVVLRAAFSTSGATFLSCQRSFHSRRAEAIAKAAGQPSPTAMPDQPPDGFAQKHGADAHVYVCYFDGAFATSLPVDGTPPPFNRTIIEVAQDGDVGTYLDGYHDVAGRPTLPLDRPSA